MKIPKPRETEIDLDASKSFILDNFNDLFVIDTGFVLCTDRFARRCVRCIFDRHSYCLLRDPLLQTKLKETLEELYV